MWIFSEDGFFSIVQKPGDSRLTIRARCAADLDRLRKRWLPTLGPTIFGAGTDYPVRATCERREAADALMAMILAIDYPNFKSRLAKTAGKLHVEAAHQVWSAMHVIEDPADAKGDHPPKGQAVAYGAVVLSDDLKRVLLREPKNHFGGYVWTFAKGRPNPGEDAITCVHREVIEELGCSIKILEPIAGWFQGDTSATKFYLSLHCDDEQAPSADETARVVWATWDEARALIAQTTSRVGRERDAAVLAEAKRWADQNRK